jgi:hypothetical protein
MSHGPHRISHRHSHLPPKAKRAPRQPR